MRGATPDFLKGDFMGGWSDAIQSQVTSANDGPAKILRKTVTVPSAALLNLAVASFQLLPAPGANKAYFVRGCYNRLRAGTIVYAGTGTNCYLNSFTVPTNSTHGCFAMFTGTFLTSAVDMCTSTSATGGDTPLSNDVNQPLYLTMQLANAITLGNGTLEITVEYSIIDLTEQV